MCFSTVWWSAPSGAGGGHSVGFRPPFALPCRPHDQHAPGSAARLHSDESGHPLRGSLFVSHITLPLGKKQVYAPHKYLLSPHFNKKHFFFEPWHNRKIIINTFFFFFRWCILAPIRLNITPTEVLLFSSLHVALLQSVLECLAGQNVAAVSSQHLGLMTGPLAKLKHDSLALERLAQAVHACLAAGCVYGNRRKYIKTPISVYWMNPRFYTLFLFI